MVELLLRMLRFLFRPLIRVIAGIGDEGEGEEWAIYEYFMPAPPKVPPCWSKLPAWVQWILRHVFFGWIWMK